MTAIRVSGAFTHDDLRIVAHLVPERDHTHVLAMVHPLVHLGDAAAIALFVVAGMVCLWLLGYRRTWAMFSVLLSWPIEFACKSALAQPAGSGLRAGHRQHRRTRARHRRQDYWRVAATCRARRHAESGVELPQRHHGARHLRAQSAHMAVPSSRRPPISKLCALGLLAALSVLGLAMVLYDWHWPSDVLGGYALGFALAAITVAVLRRPRPRDTR